MASAEISGLAAAPGTAVIPVHPHAWSEHPLGAYGHGYPSRVTAPHSKHTWPNLVRCACEYYQWLHMLVPGLLRQASGLHSYTMAIGDMPSTRPSLRCQQESSNQGYREGYRVAIAAVMYLGHAYSMMKPRCRTSLLICCGLLPSGEGSPAVHMHKKNLDARGGTIHVNGRDVCKSRCPGHEPSVESELEPRRCTNV